MKRTLLIFKKLLKLTEKKVGCLIWDLTAILSVNNIVIKNRTGPPFLLFLFPIKFLFVF